MKDEIETSLDHASEDVNQMNLGMRWDRDHLLRMLQKPFQVNMDQRPCDEPSTALAAYYKVCKLTFASSFSYLG